VIVTVALPVLPSLVAVIVADPAATPKTRPVELTWALAVSLLDHVTSRPLSVPPFASRSVTVSCTVLPATTVGDAGVTVTVATGTGSTEILAAAVFPSHEAVTLVVPTATPVTNPDALTRTLVVSPLTQLTGRANGVPLASFGVAVNCREAPTKSVAEVGETSTVATGTCVTLTVAEPLLPSLVAVIVTAPAARPVTRPEEDTRARVESLVVHATARPARGSPAASLGVAVSCTVFPMSTLDDGGSTSTVATGTLVTVTVADPLLPSLAAVMVATPVATPWTMPEAFTVATADALVVQVNVRPVTW
jgi:hypothetical protein